MPKLLTFVLLITLAQPALTNSFTYQGQLQHDGLPFSGSVILSFQLYSQAEGGVPVVDWIDLPDVPVTNGLFQVDLNFGAGAFNGNPRFLEVRVNGVEMGQRQAIRPAPMALYAFGSAGGSSWSLSGNAGTNANTQFIGTTDNQALELRTANVRSLRIEPSAELFGGLPITANVIAGSHLNEITPGVRGATISGGGVPSGDSDPNFSFEAPNRVTDHYGTVGGGYGNQAGDGGGTLADSPFATIGGGHGNTASGIQSTIGGGGGFVIVEQNKIIIAPNGASGRSSFIGGGSGNNASGDYAVIGGGALNIASGVGATVGGGGVQSIVGFPDLRQTEPNNALGEASVIGGGVGNTTTGFADAVGGGQRNSAIGGSSTVGGGSNNTANGFRSAIGGGSNNVASGVASTVTGGHTNTASGSRSMVAGGEGNCAGGSFSWAGGQRAKVRPGTNPGGSGSCTGLTYPGGNGDAGSFIWADSQNSDFVSTGSNQFLVRAAGGMAVNTNAPRAPLTVQGENQWNPTIGSGFGDFHVGTAELGLAVGVATSGGGAGAVRLWATGGNQQIAFATASTTDITLSLESNGRVGAGRRPTANRFEVEGNASKTTAGDWLANSDARIKTDVREIDGALERLLQIRPVTFRYTDAYRHAHPTVGEGRYYNVIAQEFARVFPEAVHGSGETLPEHENSADNEILQVDVHPAMITAIAAIQELAARLEGANGQLADVTQENAELRAEVAVLKVQSGQMRELADRNAELERRLGAMEERERDHAVLSERLATLETLLLQGSTALADVGP